MGYAAYRRGRDELRFSLSPQSRPHLINELLRPLIAEPAGVPTQPQTGAVKLRNDVKVNVEDFLMSGGAVVLKHVVRGATRRIHDRPAQPRQDTADRRRRLVVQLVQVRCPRLGDDQGTFPPSCD